MYAEPTRYILKCSKINNSYYALAQSPIEITAWSAQL